MTSAAQWKYFTPMLHEDDDDLDPYEYRLLGHYRRVCGQGGTCFESTRTTHDRTKISVGKVCQVRAALKAKGRIHVDDSRYPVVVTLVDRWAVNIDRYEQCSPDEQCSSGEQEAMNSVHVVNTHNESGGSVHVVNTPTIDACSSGEHVSPESSPDEHDIMNTVHLVNIVHEVKQGTYKDSTTAALEPESVAVGSFAQAGARENAANIFELYDRYGVQPPLNDLQRDVLLDAAEAYSPDQLDFAFRDAADHGKRNWPYIRAILERLRTSPEPGNVAGRIGPTLVVDERQKWRDAAAEHNPPVERIGAAMTVIGLPATTAPIDSDVQVVAPSADIPGDILDGWLRVMGQLKDQVDAAVYQQVSDTYVAALKDDATLVLAVPRHYGAELLRGRIFKTVTRLLRDLMRPGLGLEVVVGQPPTGPEPKQLGQALRGAAWMQTIVQREREAVT